ncbi:MAG: hypothetical protein GY841_15435 [FCB group bacterium]|nr:hypothetical protein [FCB group bacterium]
MSFSWNVGNDVICNNVPSFSGLDDICFPGGACLSYVMTSIQSIPSPTEIPLQFMSQLGPATAFIQPFMNVLDTVIAVYKCIDGIVDFATSLNPSELLECVPNLVEKINAMLTMIPQLSIPRMVISMVNALISLLSGLSTDLQYLVDRLDAIARGIDRAADLNDNKKKDFLVCAQDTMNESLSATAMAMQAVGRIILLVNIFMGLFGGPEIPCFGEILDGATADVLQPIIDIIDALVDLLQQLVDMVPDPIAALTKVLGDTKC